MQSLSKLIATLFFIGYSPVAPGTLASLAALPFCVLLKDTPFLYFFITGFLLVLGFWASSRAEKAFSKKDPPEIVIDEFASMFLVYAFVPPNAKFLIAGFLLFRVFDIFKIPPLKKLQVLPQGYGIMLDDIAAAILTNIILQALRFSPFFY